jgi:hypothetical protein
MSRLYLRPIPVKRALRWNAEVHRRLPALQGAMWAIAAIRGGRLERSPGGGDRDGNVLLPDRTVGVVIVGRPTARRLDSQEETISALQVLRLAALEGDASKSGHKGANSILYGACARVSRDMGALDLFTYIHHDEDGVALKAAGWIEDKSFVSDRGSHGGEWGRPSRSRKKTVEPGPKRRFCAPWSLMVAGLKEGA